MPKNKSEKPYEPNPWSLKVTIFVGIVFGFLILTWEIIAHIPKYEYIDANSEQFILNKINGNMYHIKQTSINGLITYDLTSVLSEEKYLDALSKLK